MLQIVQLISKLCKSVIRVFLVGALVGCASTGKDVNTLSPVEQKKNTQKVFPFNYEAVWRAAQISLKYPIAVNNMDNGVLETEWIRGVDGFIPPHTQRDPSSGIRYKISINMVKGKLDSSPSVRVSIFKKMERQRDFFSEVENLTSDGLEEKILLYRMEREILIDEALKKAASEKN